VGDPDPAADQIASGREIGDGGGVPAWLRKGVVLAVLVALAAAFGPGLVSSGSQDRAGRPPPPRASASRSTEPTWSVVPASVERWAARGGLAGDETFTAAAVAAVQRREPMADKLLYAAELPDGSRLALVSAKEQGDDVASHFVGAGVLALHVPPRSPVTGGSFSYAGGIATAESLAGWAGRARDGRVFAVLLGRPAPLEAEVSARIEYQSDGSSRRSWRRVAGRDGSVSVELGRDADLMIAARSVDEAASFPILIGVDADLSPQERDQIVRAIKPRGLGSGYRGPSPKSVREGIVDGVWGILDPRKADIKVVWSGALTKDKRGALVVLRRKDGPTFQLLYSFGGDDGGSTDGPRHVAWRGADRAPYVLQFVHPEIPLLLVNPSGAGTAMVKWPEGRPGERIRIGGDGLGNLMPGGSLPVAAFSGASVIVRSPSGDVVGRTRWEDNRAFDPFVLGRS